jgi:hypothetical protein
MRRAANIDDSRRVDLKALKLCQRLEDARLLLRIQGCLPEPQNSRTKRAIEKKALAAGWTPERGASLR